MEFLYETHVHTSQISACAVSSAARQVRAYKDRGYAGMIITDHFINGNSLCPKDLTWKEKMEFFVTGYEEAKKEGDKLDFDVFFGLEFSIKGSDFLTYGLGLDFLLANPGFDKLKIEDYSALVRKCGGYIAQAHPFRDAWYIEYKFPVAPDLLDGVEVYNASMDDDTNEKAMVFAKTHNLALQAGSDSHSEYRDFCSGVRLDKRAGSIFDIINAIKTGNAGLILPAQK